MLKRTFALQTEEDANLAPQMGDGGFQFNPAAAGGNNPGDSMQGGGAGSTPFNF